jgi:hypothetical protein
VKIARFRIERLQRVGSWTRRFDVGHVEVHHAPPDADGRRPVIETTELQASRAPEQLCGAGEISRVPRGCQRLVEGP